MLGIQTSRRLMTALLMICLTPSAVTRGQAPAARQTAGTESLTYNIEWRLINAGTAKLQHSGSQLVLRLESTGLVSKLYRVNDTYTANHDAGFCATSLHFEAEEGRRKRDTRVTYDRTRNR